eukprot:scaffold106_cov109-Isochrysis_galbana.AAC.11
MAPHGGRLCLGARNRVLQELKARLGKTQGSGGRGAGSCPPPTVRHTLLCCTTADGALVVMRAYGL